MQDLQHFGGRWAVGAFGWLGYIGPMFRRSFLSEMNAACMLPSLPSLILNCSGKVSHALLGRVEQRLQTRLLWGCTWVQTAFPGPRSAMEDCETSRSSSLSSPDAAHAFPTITGKPMLQINRYFMWHP